MEVFNQHNIPQGSSLEIEFSGEVGTGKGPTQEFFTYFCRDIREVQLRSLGLWWDSGSSDSTHFCPANGLFPAPLNPLASVADRAKKLDAFEVLTFVACAERSQPDVTLTCDVSGHRMDLCQGDSRWSPARPSNLGSFQSSASRTSAGGGRLEAAGTRGEVYPCEALRDWTNGENEVVNLDNVDEYVRLLPQVRAVPMAVVC
eukprot:764079-Hanusia_phi.AAC.6